MRGLHLDYAAGVLVWLLPLVAGCGADDLFIAANLDRDEDCEFVADRDNAMALAEYDIAQGATKGSIACERPFMAFLLVENPNSDSVVVESAQVKLMDAQHRTIQFDAAALSLPNPFLLTVGSPIAGDADGVVAIEAFPLDYAQQIPAHFVGLQMIVQVEMFGTTAGGSEVESNSFSFAVAVCDGCRTLCSSDPAAEEVECSSRDLGVKRAFCIDDEC
jgi:LSD1 subclass zinc finger protein